MKLKALSVAVVKKSLIENKWWVTAGASLLLLVFILVITPVIISQQFQKWVLANGGEKVSVENIDFNPFTAKLDIQNIVIERAGYQPFLLPELKLQAQWRDLFSHRFVIQSVSIIGVQLTVDHSQPQQEHIGGILLENFLSGKSEADPDSKPWHFQLHDLQLQDVHLVYKQPGLESVVDITSLSLSRLDSEPVAKPALISANGAIDNAPFMINGSMALFSATPGFTGKVVLEKLDISPYLVLISQDMKQNHLVASINSQIQVGLGKEQALTAEYDGQLSLENVSWLDPDIELKARQLSWRGAIDLFKSSTSAMKIRTSGKLQADELALDMKTATLTLANDQFLWQGKVDTEISPDTDIAINLNGQLLNNLLDLELEKQDFIVKNGNLNWQGNADLRLKNNGQLKVISEGKLQNEALRLERSQQQVQLITGVIAWQGNVNLVNDAEMFDIASLSDLKLSGLKMQRIDGQQRLLMSQNIQAEKIDIQSLDEIRINDLSFSGLSIGRPQKLEKLPVELAGFINYDELDIQQISYSAERGIHLGNVIQDGVKHVFIREANGEWGFDTFIGAMERLASKSAEGEAVDEGKAEAQVETKKLPLKIDSIVINPGGQLYYVDRSLPNTFIQKIDIESASLTGLNSENVVQGSDLKVKAKLDNARLDINGMVSVFAAEPTFDLKAEIKALSLLPYSIFMEKALGYEVDSGSLNAKSSLLGKDGKLESTTDLTLHQLDIRALTEKQLKAIDAKLNSGLETGLNMLKDKHDTIKLTLPVNGSFDNLQVSPNDVINQALGSAMKSGAKTYFAAALFPFGTLLVIADAAADGAMQVRLDPVFFEAGSSDMASKYREYLAKVAKVLVEKPEIHVKVCGVSTSSDSQFIENTMREAFLARQSPVDEKAAAMDKKTAAQTTEQAAFIADPKVLKQQLTELAVKRAQLVSDFLIQSQDVEPTRLISCQPRMELDSEEAKPRSDLLL